jgi:hypothetical protein
MTIRKAALIAAIGCAITIVVPEAYGFFLDVFSVLASPHFGLWTFGQFIPDLVLPVFFVFLYGEASGRIKPEARSIAAIPAAVLMLAGGLYVIWLMHGTATVSSQPRTIVGFSVPLMFISQSIWVVIRLLWVAIFIGFAVDTRATTGRTIPRLAAVLVICYAAFVSLGWYQQTHSSTPRPTVQLHPYPALLLDAFNLLAWASVPVLLVLPVVLWRRWQAQLSVHQNVLG